MSDDVQRIKATESQVGGDHYAEMKIQPIEFAHANQFGPCETLALRYISRHRRKNGRQDIEKAIHVLELLLEFEYGGPERDANGQ